MAAGSSVLAGAAVPLARAASKASAPNIVFILADDLGYADVGCYGSRENRTPHVDRIAAQGVRLTQGYSNSPVCSPTRTALITGRYQYRLPGGLEEPLRPGRGVGLPPGHPTLPLLLKALGYRTALVGKWHLGSPPEFGPLRSGYDRFFGFHSGGADYFSYELRVRGHLEDSGLYDQEKQVAADGYLTDLLGARAVREIESAAQARQPLFLSLHFNAPHWPWEGPEDEATSAKLKDTRHYDGGSLAIFRSMVERMDRNVGHVLEALERSGLADNTVVVFTSDNGGERFSDVWPFIGMKGEVLEGGIRVPLIVRWPRRIAAGSTSAQVMASMDFAPTLLAAASGTSAPPLPFDGVNLLPTLLGESAVVPRKLFWRFKANEQAAVRDGDLKYVKLGAQEALFDLAMDQRERANLKDKLPEAFSRLKAGFAAWNATMLAYPNESYSGGTKTGNYLDRF